MLLTLRKTPACTVGLLGSAPTIWPVQVWAAVCRSFWLRNGDRIWGASAFQFCPLPGPDLPSPIPYTAWHELTTAYSVFFSNPSDPTCDGEIGRLSFWHWLNVAECFMVLLWHSLPAQWGILQGRLINVGWYFDLYWILEAPSLLFLLLCIFSVSL